MFVILPLRDFAAFFFFWQDDDGDGVFYVADSDEERREGLNKVSCVCVHLSILFGVMMECCYEFGCGRDGAEEEGFLQAGVEA